MSYCASLTNSQVVNVLRDEKSRIDRHPDGPADVLETARELYQEAREECLRRGIEPDGAL